MFAWPALWGEQMVCLRVVLYREYRGIIQDVPGKVLYLLNAYSSRYNNREYGWLSLVLSIASIAPARIDAVANG